MHDSRHTYGCDGEGDGDDQLLQAHVGHDVRRPGNEQRHARHRNQPCVCAVGVVGQCGMRHTAKSRHMMTMHAYICPDPPPSQRILPQPPTKTTRAHAPMAAPCIARKATMAPTVDARPKPTLADTLTA